MEKGQEVKPGTKLYEFDTEELAMTLEQRNLELDKINNSISNLNNQIATLTAEKKNARPVSSYLYDSDPGTSDQCEAGRIQL